MAWCRQATSHYLSHCWRSPMASLEHNELNFPTLVCAVWRLYPNHTVKGTGCLPSRLQHYRLREYSQLLRVHWQEMLVAGISLHTYIIVYFYIHFIKSPRYTGGDFMFLYRFVRCRRCRPQILVHAITFEQLFGFLSFLAQLLALTCRLPD